MSFIHWKEVLWLVSSELPVEAVNFFYTHSFQSFLERSYYFYFLPLSPEGLSKVKIPQPIDDFSVVFGELTSVLSLFRWD